MGIEIIVALIAAGGSVVGSWIANSAAMRAQNARLERELAVVKAEIVELKYEVRKHNGFAERMPVVENEIEHLKKYHKQ